MNKVTTGIVIALALVVVGGIFLMGRDGTEGLALNPNSQQEENTNNGNTETPQNGTTEDGLIDGEVNGEVDVNLNGGDTLEEVVITKTDEGFTPAQVEITKGQTVRFVNNSNRDMWPASAFHPTHTIYPEKTGSDCLGSSFDACEGIPPGESWPFTFNEVGEWRYHDHLNASRSGTVIVIE